MWDLSASSQTAGRHSGLRRPVHRRKARLKNDPRNPWTGRGLLEQFSELNNRVIDRFSPIEREDIGIDTCPGSDCDSTHSAEVDYAALLPRMFKMNIGYFLLQAASEKGKQRVDKLCGQYSRKNANRVPQVCFVGVIDPINPRVETPEEVSADLVLASKHIPLERMGSTDDCGLSPFSIDAKPRHGFSDAARDSAFEKITARVTGTKVASARLAL
jgi:methionine synthase II (cobalamin-independent)